MRRIRFILEKEFRQILRNKLMLPILFIMPVVQLFLLSYAANFEVKNLKVHVVDYDVSSLSKKLLNKLHGSDYFILSSRSHDTEKAYFNLDQNIADIGLIIPNNFSENLYSGETVEVQLLINAINGTKAALANNYMQNIVSDFGKEFHSDNITVQPTKQFKGLKISHRHWFNKYEDYKIFMVPGILVLLVTMIAMFLSSINIVREKEIGTAEQLNVTTIRKPEFIIGKLLPFWILALLELSIGLLLGWLIFDVPIRGSIGLVYLFAMLYIITVLGLGMFVSTITDRQQQAMFISWFLLVIFILMSGLFTPIESMPEWARVITKFNPIAYFVQFMRMVMLKGSSSEHVTHLFISIGIYALLTNSLAILNYRKTTK